MATRTSKTLGNRILSPEAVHIIRTSEHRDVPALCERYGVSDGTIRLIQGAEPSQLSWAYGGDASKVPAGHRVIVPTDRRKKKPAERPMVPAVPSQRLTPEDRKIVEMFRSLLAEGGYSPISHAVLGIVDRLTSVEVKS